VLFCDVSRWPHIEIHTADCKDVVKARTKKFATGTVEGTDPEDAIAQYIQNVARDGVELDRTCFRIMPCVARVSRG
jgi:hypothetical protein